MIGGDWSCQRNHGNNGRQSYTRANMACGGRIVNANNRPCNRDLFVGSCSDMNIRPDMNADATTALPVDPAAYGLRGPDLLVRAVLAVTRSLPGNWLGFRISTPFRRVAINWLGERPVDTALWGARARLYPRHNSCEKNALFTPQAFDLKERKALASTIDRRLGEGGIFTFVDIGANVGLYSLFVAARGGARARILAAEPQPGIVDRLRFNLHSNPGPNVTVIPVAVTDRDGETELVIRRDRSGSYVAKSAGGVEPADIVRVRCRPLMAILAEAGIASIDALKIDIEGAEDLALAPFLREARAELLPQLVLIEDRPDWTMDLYALLRERGYRQAARTRYNIIFRLPDGSDRDMRGLVRWGNVLVGKLVEAMWWGQQPRFTDVGCTFRAVWKEAWLRIRERMAGVGPEFSPEMMIEMLRARRRVIEIPVSYYARVSGTSKHSENYFKISRTALRMLRVIFKKRFLGDWRP